jgi:hypothetical protein
MDLAIQIFLIPSIFEYVSCANCVSAALIMTVSMPHGFQTHLSQIQAARVVFCDCLYTLHVLQMLQV